MKTPKDFYNDAIYHVDGVEYYVDINKLETAFYQFSEYLAGCNKHSTTKKITKKMKTLHQSTAEMIQKELESLPEEYAQSKFNSIHEGYAVILEEVRELEQEVFFGEKKAAQNKIWTKEQTKALHRERMREECIQIAAMCARFIQELTPET